MFNQPGYTIPELTEKRQRLADEGCFENQRLICWPGWLTFEDIQWMLAAGLLTEKFHGSATYGAVTIWWK